MPICRLTVAITNILVSHEGRIGRNGLHQMTKLMFDNLERLGNAHSAAKDIKVETPRKPADPLPRC